MTIFRHGYHEEKPHRAKRILWRALNASLFPILPQAGRRALLRLFGAKIAPTQTPIYGSVRVFAPWNLEVGEWCCVGPRVRIYNKGEVKLGDRVVVSQDVFLCTATHDVNDADMKLVVKPIVIGSNAWLASHAKVLPGVTLGEGAVAACAAVVTKDVAPWTIVGGVPARKIGERRIRA